jgi:hypothetical protein
MTATPHRHWYQFSLKALMVLMVVVAVSCGWVKWKLDGKQRERGALAELNKIGGNFNYDWQYAGQSAPPGPVWVRKLLGDDFFSKVVLIQIEGDHVTDDWLLHLEPLTGLEHVYLKCPRITDDGLSHLSRLNLRELNLEGSRVTDVSLVSLQNFTQLSYLNLSGTGVTNSGITQLQQALPNCQIVHSIPPKSAGR